MFSKEHIVRTAANKITRALYTNYISLQLKNSKYQNYSSEGLASQNFLLFSNLFSTPFFQNLRLKKQNLIYTCCFDTPFYGVLLIVVYENNTHQTI